MSADIKTLTAKLAQITESAILTEAKGHLDHPEDLVFLEGSSGAMRAVQATVQTVKNPKTVTIKFDGYPALIFGRDTEGRFSIMDKHMFNKKDGSGRAVYSPEQFVQYDQDRGVDRPGLHQIIQLIWKGLEQETAKARGYYWGDLLFSAPLAAHNGLYAFRANPNGISYTVDVNSPFGKLLANKVAGIAVHQHFEPGSPDTDHATTLNGTIGQLMNTSNVAIVPTAMPITPKLKLSAAVLNKTNAVIQKYGQAVDALFNTAPQARTSFSALFTVYINKKIVAGDLQNLLGDFMTFFNSRPMTDSMRAKLTKHFEEHKEGLVGAFAIWITVYNLKTAVVTQLDTASKTSPVKGYLQSGAETQEGFVANGLKFVDRMGFSRQNLAGR